MAFNSNTYRTNKWRRTAWENLAEARAIKARVLAGTACDWEAPRIKFFVEQALGAMRLYLSGKEIQALTSKKHR